MYFSVPESKMSKKMSRNVLCNLIIHLSMFTELSEVLIKLHFGIIRILLSVTEKQRICEHC